VTKTPTPVPTFCAVLLLPPLGWEVPVGVTLPVAVPVPTCLVDSTRVGCTAVADQLAFAARRSTFPHCGKAFEAPGLNVPATM